jgi:hypothetical protein
MTDPTQFYPFTNLVDMSPEAIERRIKEVFQMNKLCAWLGEAQPVEQSDRVAEDSPAYSEI